MADYSPEDHNNSKLLLILFLRMCKNGRETQDVSYIAAVFMAKHSCHASKM